MRKAECRKLQIQTVSPMQAAQFLVGIALKRYTSDNVACIVLDFIGAEQRAEDSASSDNENGGGSGGIFGKISGLFGKKGK